ncbi:hypothetical protein GCM10023311_00720 [Flaviramulus aquimarinus]|uniref:Glycosyltransferase 2-like domain-containing protein n=1 Tax=Flaviramulus aquimarinus TaxID=1170456 RepID=A0ABP9ESD7_9FLAO
MKLSILIAMYNTEKYIGNCLESLINQDIKVEDYEIIVINDGSTDNSVSVVESYIKRNKNIVLYNQSNIGITQTSNKLLKLAKGKYLYKIDSDDYIAHNTLGTLLKIAEKSNLDALGFNSCKTTRLDLHKLDTEIISEDLKICTGVEYWSKSNNPKSSANWYLIKNDFIIKNNITFELEDNPMSDTPFTFQLFIAIERFVFLSNVIHRYVQVPTSGSNNRNANHLRKRILKRKALINKLRAISVKLENKDKSKYIGIINSLKFWSDVNVYFLFQKFLYVNISIGDIIKIRKELEQIKAYPMISFTGDQSFSKKHKLITSFLNHKYLFFVGLYPLRMLVKLKLLKLSFR